MGFMREGWPMGNICLKHSQNLGLHYLHEIEIRVVYMYNAIWNHTCTSTFVDSMKSMKSQSRKGFVYYYVHNKYC